MDCSEVKELLSAYYDDELSSVKRTAVAEHLAGCFACAHELEGFRSLSVLAEGLASPEPPTHIWRQLEEQLDGERLVTERWRWTRQPVVRLGLATAAAILIAAGWFGYRTWIGHGGDRQFTVVFGQYLDEFHRDPHAAQRILLTNYEGQAMDAEQAVHTVGYRSAVADGMPDDYSVESTYVMKMPCCTCVQSLCQRSDGTTIAVFEHDADEPNWFGDRPATEENCRGKQCRIVHLDNRLAATWQRGNRHITVVGVRDTAEIERLVAWFDERRVRP